MIGVGGGKNGAFNTTQTKRERERERE